MVVRVLCLPGYGQNAVTFHRKFAAVQKQCKGVDFVILDPPHILQAVHDSSNSLPFQFTATQDESSSISESNDNNSNNNRTMLLPELTPLAWWIPNEDKTVYQGVKDTMAYLYDFLEKQESPFDGVLGFSQGAATAAIIIALLEGAPQYPGPRPNHPPLRFGVLISGFKPLDVELCSLFERSITTPTLHVLGRTDVIVSKTRSQSLVNACESPRVEWHEGGHYIPAKTSWRTFFKAYLSSFDSSSVISHVQVSSPSSYILPSESPPSSSNDPGADT